MVKQKIEKGEAKSWKGEKQKDRKLERIGRYKGLKQIDKEHRTDRKIRRMERTNINKK